MPETGVGAILPQPGRFLVVGDSILDVYVFGTAIGRSAETPTLVARETETRSSLGGAFLLVRNLLALGAEVDFVTLVGEDAEAAAITAFSHPRLRLHPLRDAGRRTTSKKRYWVDGYKLLQFDQLDNRPLPGDLQRQLLEACDALLPQAAALLISDYRHGFLTETVAAALLVAAARAAVPSLVDSQVAQSSANHHWYSGAGVICMNLHEAQLNAPELSAHPTPDELRQLCARLRSGGVVVKLGAEGSVAWLGEKAWAVPAWTVQPVDTIGAGDAFLAAFSICQHLPPAQSLRVANCWAGLSTQVHGPHPPSRESLDAALAGLRA